MRKLFPMLLFTLLLALLMAVPALAADFTYDDFSATLTVPDSYTMLTTSNLADHEDLLAKQGLTVEAAQADWAARGVRFQAWNAAGDMCIELSAVQDDFAMQYWDVNEITSDERATYRLGHTSDKNGYYRNLGYDYSSAQWKNGKNYARFLVLEYTRSHNGVSYAGYGRKSIRNGYSIYLECQVYGRSPKKADNNALQAILDTLKFNEIFPRPSSAVQRVTFDEVPPTETNSGKFTVSGTGTSGQYVILCLMRLSGGEPINYETQIPKNGKFSFTIQLPQEGVWLMTYTITDASGMSVLTAWAAGKFSSTSVKKFFDEFDLASKINNRTLIIPGKVAVMKGEIQDKLPDWNVVVGTREAVELVKYLKDGEYKAAAEAAAAAKAPAGEKKETVDANAPLDFEKIAASIPAIKIRDDLDAHYKQRDPESPKFVTIGERIHCISPVIREAMATFNPDPILERAAQQIKAGATYLDVNIGPAESNGPELMTWAVKLLQENFNNVPLALDTANKRAIEAGIKVYNRTNGKPIVNSADAGSRISYIDLAAANDAICVALCSADGIAKDNEERMMHCHHMLERGLSLGMEATDLWFDPLFLVVKGMQDKQMDVLNAIKLFADEGLKSTGGLSNNSNGAPKNVRPIMDSALVAMAMMQGLTSAIVNPNDLRLMETIKSCDIFKNNELYSDSYLDV